MKNRFGNTAAGQHPPNRASRKSLGLVSLAVLLLFSFASLCSAQTQVHGQLTQIAAGSTEVWGINGSGEVYQYTSSGFTQVIPGDLFQITVGTGSKNVWGINASEEIYNYDTALKPPAFEHVHGQLVQIQAGGQGVWGLNASGDIYVWNGTAFVAPPHGQPVPFCSVFVGGYEIGVWALDCTHGDAYYYDGSTETFVDSTGSNLVSIAVGNSEVWGITKTGVFVYHPCCNFWSQPDTEAQLVQMSVGTNKQVYGVNASGAVYLYNSTSKKFGLVTDSEDFVQISVGGSAAGIWGITSDGAIYKF